METFPKIAFRQVRDFSEILNATFAFVRQNFMKLGKSILFLVGPMILLASIFYGLYNAEIMSFGATQQPLNILTYMLLMLGTMIGSTALFIGVVSEYVMLYIDRGYAEFDLDDVWQAVKKDLGMIILTALSFVFVVGLGTIFCFLPGIYFFVVLSMLLVMRIRERNDLGAAFSRCFKLISGHWWPTFGIIFVTYLIHTAMSFIFYIPNYIVTFWNAFHTTAPGAGLADRRGLFIVTSTLALVGSYLFYTIPILAISFQYFNLVERREAAGLMEKIDQLGTPSEGTA